MCKYFSCVFLPDGAINFTETDSHEDVIARLCLKDASEFNRTFLRVECPGGDIANFELDENTDNLPSWYSENEQEYHTKLAKLLARVNKIKLERDAMYAKFQTERAEVYAKWKTERAEVGAKWKTELNAVYAKFHTERAEVDAKLEKIAEFVRERRPDTTGEGA